MKITKRYLVIPVGIGAKEASLRFLKNGTLLFDLKVRYQAENPDFLFWQPTLPLFGQDVSAELDGLPIELTQTDRRDDSGIGSEPLRPRLHFTARRGWINDPNGLCFDGKRYHLFFQHNPVGVLWGNMHWGHAVSEDLLRWREEDDALFPDRFGTMYSGSAVIDDRNVSGLGEKALCLFYTSCGDTANGGNSLLSHGMESLQNLAFSTDGGKTFTKYRQNPIVGEITKENRDPKIVYAEELGCYLMALYLEGNDYLLLTSSDLLHWQSRQRLTIEGESECPDLYPLAPEGCPDQRLWVLTGASDRYLVGRLSPEGALFRPVQSVKQYQIGKGNYAAQTFFGTEGRRIKTAWGMMPAPNCIFNNQLSLFTEVSLVKLKGEYYLRTLPIAEYDRLACPLFCETTDRMPLRKLPEKAYELTVTPETEDGLLTITANGRTFLLNLSENLLRDGDNEIPLRISDRPISLRMIVDTLGIELFSDDGLIHYAAAHIGESTLSTEGKAAISVRVFRDPDGEEVREC